MATPYNRDPQATKRIEKIAEFTQRMERLIEGKEPIPEYFNMSVEDAMGQWTSYIDKRQNRIIAELEAAVTVLKENLNLQAPSMWTKPEQMLQTIREMKKNRDSAPHDITPGKASKLFHDFKEPAASIKGISIKDATNTFQEIYNRLNTLAETFGTEFTHLENVVRAKIIAGEDRETTRTWVKERAVSMIEILDYIDDTYSTLSGNKKPERSNIPPLTPN